ncbi:ROK family transcriptional regulator [Paenibacillaceae bacterium]|nr:ROK family transcriptional regulator [Paenibacillaceae bacterium]
MKKQIVTAKTTGDTMLIKKINTAIVLECVLKHAPLSRADISERTGLNKATVSSLVQDLIDSYLIVESGMGKSSGGRKPVMLLFNREAGHAVGIDLGVNYIRGVLTDLEGSIIEERLTSLTTVRAEEVLPVLEQLIAELIACAPSSPYGIVGIGLGVPGIVDDSGTVLFAPNLKWDNLPLQDQLANRFGLPVVIDNEANAGAQGEQRYGAGQGIANQIYVSVGIGIGTGIILNKSLYKGTSGFSGELGHLSIDFAGKLCSCGNRGCWELYASEHALLEGAARLGIHDLQSLVQAAAGGSDEAIGLFASIGEYLGIGIANIINSFNPDVVIIGNRITMARPWIEASLRNTVEQRTLPFHRRDMQILFAELGEQSAVRGAAYDAINRFFTLVKSGESSVVTE